MRVLHDWLLTPERIAIHLPTATAVVADLHLGYDLARQQSGEALPSFGVDEALSRLSSALARHPFRRLVFAGDLAENAAALPAVSQLLSWISSVGVELVALVPGNHDRRLPVTCGLPLQPKGTMLGAWRIVHGDRPLARTPTVCGHFHPVIRWPHATAPVYLMTANRLVLPAFSADASGVNVLGKPVWARYCCAAIVGDRVFDLGPLSSLRRRLMGLGRLPAKRLASAARARPQNGWWAASARRRGKHGPPR